MLFVLIGKKNIAFWEFGHHPSRLGSWHFTPKRKSPFMSSIFNLNAFVQIKQQFKLQEFIVCLAVQGFGQEEGLEHSIGQEHFSPHGSHQVPNCCVPLRSPQECPVLLSSPSSSCSSFPTPVCQGFSGVHR